MKLSKRQKSNPYSSAIDNGINQSVHPHCADPNSPLNGKLSDNGQLREDVHHAIFNKESVAPNKVEIKPIPKKYDNDGAIIKDFEPITDPEQLKRYQELCAIVTHHYPGAMGRYKVIEGLRILSEWGLEGEEALKSISDSMVEWLKWTPPPAHHDRTAKRPPDINLIACKTWDEFHAAKVPSHTRTQQEDRHGMALFAQKMQERAQ